MKILKEKSYTINIVKPEDKEEDDEIQEIIKDTKDISHLTDIKNWIPQKAGKDLKNT